MKKTKLFLFSLCAILLLSSCNSSKKHLETPEDATKVFVQAFYTADFDALYKCTVQNNRPIIQQIQKLTTSQKGKQEQMQKNEVEIKDVKCISQDDSIAECQCVFLFNKNEKDITYNLRKEDGNWHVDLSIQY